MSSRSGESRRDQGEEPRMKWHPVFRYENAPFFLYWKDFVASKKTLFAYSNEMAEIHYKATVTLAKDM